LTEKLNTNNIYSILVKNMMRKMLSAVFVFGLVFTIMTGAVSPRSNGMMSDTCRIGGYVYNSADGITKIRENNTWICNNITVYNVSEYEAGIIDIAINNNDTDHGEDFLEKDKFYFDAGEQWMNWSSGDVLVSVGEANNNGVNYIFLAGAVLEAPPNYFEDTEWEPIPTPIVYAKDDTWINLSIPKFTNPVLASYGRTGTPNVNNTIGFAVYRNGTEHIGNAPYYNETHYFYNDTISSGVVYHYSAAPIAKGNYTTYCKSLLVSSEELSVVLNSPAGGEIWAGGEEHTISYEITGGSPLYNVVLGYSTDGGATYPNTINDEPITHNEEGTYTYTWVPEIDGVAEMVKVRINVTDYALSLVSASSSSNFIVDSTAPTIKSTIPAAGGSVSISKRVIVVFSEKMNKTATVSAFSISPNPGGWAWTWNDSSMKGTHNPFIFDTIYTATISTAAKDLAGNYLAEDYSWNFTANMSVCLNSPVLGDVWTGGVEHGINYTVSGGVPDYEVKMYYSHNGGDWSFIAFDNRTEEGTYEYLWACPSIDSETVNMKIILVDANETESIDTSGNFEIDSTAPYIITYTGNDTYITTTESIMVVFSEKMNKASAESAFSLKDADDVDVNGTFSWNENVMSFVPDENLTSNMNYSATINTNATDKSNPGNHLVLDVSWSFIAVEGSGDIIVGSPIISPSPEKGKTSTITVTVSNTGPEAFNISGHLTVKFYASRDGKTWTPIATKYIQNIWEGNSSSAYTTFTFDDYGEYYFLVEVTSNNPADTFPGGEKTGRASASVNIPKPAEEIGAGPYTLIALMVVIVIIVAALILLNLKKKGGLTLKEKEEEETEEGGEEKGEE
jgi:hypothetical protein